MNNATLRLEQMKNGTCITWLICPKMSNKEEGMRVVDEEEGMRVDEDEECRLAEPSLDNCSLHG